MKEGALSEGQCFFMSLFHRRTIMIYQGRED